MVSQIWKTRSIFLFLSLGALSIPLATTYAKDLWDKPGCHRVAHTRKIAIPDCVEFEVKTYACRGYCESWAIPSAINTLKVNPNQVITSIGQCCNMMDTEDVEVRVLCVEGMKDLVFKSAVSCSCYHCKKD